MPFENHQNGLNCKPVTERTGTEKKRGARRSSAETSTTSTPRSSGVRAAPRPAPGLPVRGRLVAIRVNVVRTPFSSDDSAVSRLKLKLPPGKKRPVACDTLGGRVAGLMRAEWTRQRQCAVYFAAVGDGRRWRCERRATAYSHK
ncbi:hypothetical protein EVAR_25619_1 [Eumeta japonica]|uniref:Uncharacterized protein n=1 Tax=Eumeta variegata TaxID=151549 RepID=A0A4C1V2P4_EUMVA|nr:hypothetical protein EVAR_25619_1 [Eumeta japonica]